MPDLSQLLVVSADPFLFYTFVAAGFLAVVSLGSGWRRADFLAVVRPQGLFRVTVAVLAAFLLVLLADTLQTRPEAGSSAWLETLRGLSRFPLYVVTLAYGPSAGLLAAGLFAAFASTGLPGWPEAVLALELVVLGWFALAPSPRTARWAGPAGALLAYFLAWSTGGAALLQGVSGDGTVLAAHLAYHQAAAPGVALSTVLLFLVGPEMYKKFFPHSRVAPQPGDAPAATPKTAAQPAGANAAEKRGPARGRRATDQPAASDSQRVGRRRDDPVNSLVDPDTAAPGLSLPHADAELVAPLERPAPGAAAPPLRDAPHDVEP